MNRGLPQGRKRLFASGNFYTQDKRARFVAVANPKLAVAPERYLPLLLNTGRIRDQWHTMTRTGKSPRLGAHIDEPQVSVHPEDAKSFGVVDGAFARISTLHGSAVLRVAVSDAQRRGEIFAPIHWNATTASDARIGALVQPACDPVSGQPELKATQATLAPAQFAVHGFLLAREAVAMPAGIWWARSTIEGGSGYRLAVPASVGHWSDVAKQLLKSDGVLAELLDEGQGRYRAALIRDGQLEACLFLAKTPQALPSWEWLKQQLGCAYADRLRPARAAVGPRARCRLRQRSHRLRLLRRRPQSDLRRRRERTGQLRRGHRRQAQGRAPTAARACRRFGGWSRKQRQSSPSAF